MAVKDRAGPYAQRLLDDRELQRDLRELASAIRGGYGRAEKKKKKPSRLAEDKKFRKSAQRAAASLKDAQARFRGEEPKSHRGRKVLIFLVAVGGIALLARKAMTDEGTPAPSPSPVSPTS
jgi:hypothetical protein